MLTRESFEVHTILIETISSLIEQNIFENLILDIIVKYFIPSLV
jgi:hypothetical protein